MVKCIRRDIDIRHTGNDYFAVCEYQDHSSILFWAVDKS